MSRMPMMYTGMHVHMHMKEFGRVHASAKKVQCEQCTGRLAHYFVIHRVSSPPYPLAGQRLVQTLTYIPGGS